MHTLRPFRLQLMQRYTRPVMGPLPRWNVRASFIDTYAVRSPFLAYSHAAASHSVSLYRQRQAGHEAPTPLPPTTTNFLIIAAAITAVALLSHLLPSPSLPSPSPVSPFCPMPPAAAPS